MSAETLEELLPKYISDKCYASIIQIYRDMFELAPKSNLRHSNSRTQDSSHKKEKDTKNKRLSRGKTVPVKNVSLVLSRSKSMVNINSGKIATNDSTFFERDSRSNINYSSSWYIQKPTHHKDFELMF